ncbi:DUF998 domain-containing protein [Streptomyces liangshanensis]|uniref:DUF998 domain-containing protein n=1 Tax=Streptomyces liangshanensis TaxID=2717324 RepID=A0A6G9GZL6_9ACTN|nr:DUF998 domain-containing protein [Streptomyces liangshanensis]QIQ03664.1 DUF998 domain-containing protein [Streptomyces liangshanensis]
MRLAPWWALLSSGSAPLLLVGGWTTAELLQGPGYDPVTQTISILAAYGAPGYWVMNAMLVTLGTCYLATARGLHAAKLPGRLALAGGGVAAIALTLFPAPVSGGNFGHGTVVTIGFALMAAWPVLAANRTGKGPWALRLPAAIVASALMVLGAAWFLVELQTRGAAGVAERVLTAAQAVWPLLVVTSCVHHPAREERETA